jgi:hypothetical protein
VVKTFFSSFNCEKKEENATQCITYMNGLPGVTCTLASRFASLLSRTLPGTKVLKFAPATFRQREKQQLNIALNIGTEYCFYLMMVVFILCIGFAIFTKVIHK